MEGTQFKVDMDECQTTYELAQTQNDFENWLAENAQVVALMAEINFLQSENRFLKRKVAQIRQAMRDLIVASCDQEPLSN